MGHVMSHDVMDGSCDVTRCLSSCSLYAVILFAMACGLAVGLMMAIVCATLYAGLLRAP